MKPCAERHSGGRLAWRARAGLLVVLLAAAAPAEDLSRFTGFTRPGTPDDVQTGDKIRFVADDPEERDKAFGGTVYFTVIEHGKGGAWGDGVKDLDKRFRRGVDSGGNPSPALDQEAKYLYLYQTVNDRGTNPPIQSTSIRLLVDVKRKEITSWGYFSGVGFATVKLAAGKKTDSGILPVSATHGAAETPAEKMYRDQAPPIPAPQAFRLSPIPERREAMLRQGLSGVVSRVWEVLDPAADPDYVMLLAGSDSIKPSFRAIWAAQGALPKGMRSTVFGFTSNLPPTNEAVQLRASGGSASAIVPAGLGADRSEPGSTGPGVSAAGQAPTPLPETLPSEPRETTPPPPGSPPPPPPPPFPDVLLVPAAPPAPGASPPLIPPSLGGGGVGVGSSLAAVPAISGSSSTGTSAGQSSQQQSQTLLPSSVVPLTVISPVIQSPALNQQQSVSILTPAPQQATTSVTVSVQQSQNQLQSQTQTQAQTQTQHEGQPPAVVPEPAAFVLALLGLPFLLFLRPRKSVAHQPG